MNSILIIGGGFVAKSLAERLSRCSDVSVVTSRVGSVTQLTCNPKFYSSLDKFQRSRVRPDVVIFSTGPSSTKVCAESLNRFKTELVLSIRYAEKIRAHSFIYVSSGGAIYAPSSSQLTESSPLDVDSAYSRFHIDCEDLLRSSNVILNRLCFRLGNPFGKYQNPSRSVGFVGMAMRSALFSSRLTIIGDGLICRDFFHINLFTDFLAAGSFSSHRGFQVVNFGSGESMSLLDVVRMVSKVTSRELRVDWRPDLSTSRPIVRLDVSKLSRVFGFAPDYDAESAFRQLFEEWSALPEDDLNRF